LKVRSHGGECPFRTIHVFTGMEIQNDFPPLLASHKEGVYEHICHALKDKLATASHVRVALVVNDFKKKAHTYPDGAKIYVTSYLAIYYFNSKHLGILFGPYAACPSHWDYLHCTETLYANWDCLGDHRIENEEALRQFETANPVMPVKLLVPSRPLPPVPQSQPQPKPRQPSRLEQAAVSLKQRVANKITKLRVSAAG
jgi:hypothetical protein